jgi:hypothetical protein
LGLVKKRFLQIEDEFKRMAAVQMNDVRLQQYFERVFPDPTRGSDSDRYGKALQEARQNRESAEYFFLKGRGNDLKGTAGTLWAAYNGVTEFVDRPVEVNKAKTEAALTRAYDQKLKDMWFGEGYSIKARAFTVAAQYGGAWSEVLPPAHPL